MSKATLINWVSLVILVVATIFTHYWVWGLLFIFWAAYALKSDNSHLLLPVNKQNEPLLYWAVNLMWLVFGIWYLAFDILWRFGVYNISGFDLYPG